MDPSEYLAFVPLLFYGIALADLLGQWRRFFDKAFLYWPYFLTTIMLTEVAVWNVYMYLEVVAHLEGIGYFRYWLYLVQPMIFLITVSALTPEAENQDTEGYFKQRISIVFGLIAAYIASHFLPAFYHSADFDYVRMISIAICILIAVTRRTWLVYVMAVVWFLGLFLRA